MKRRYALPVLLLIFAVLAVGIVTAGSLLYRSQRDSCRTEAERNLAAVADLKASELSAWRKERFADAGVFYKNSSFTALVRRCIERPQDSLLREELRTWIGSFQASYGYDHVALLDAACNEWMSVPDTKQPQSTLTLKKAREVMRSGQPTFADFYPDEFTKKVYLRLFVPIFDGPSGERPLGVLRLRIDPHAYLYPFIQRWPTPSETAETLLVRLEGNEVVFLNELKSQKDTALTLRMSLDRSDNLAVKAALGQEGIVEGIDYRGVPVAAALRAVPDSPWLLVAKMDTAEVYAPMRERLWLVILFVGALLFGLAAAVGFVWRWQHVTLYREKHEAEHKYRAIVEASADGILMADVETKMLKYPNPALCRMLGYTEQELRAMAMADIHPKDALQHVLAEFEKQVREDKRVAQDIPCLRKDGAIVYVDINAANATIDGRKSLVGAFRDITEQKQREEKRQKLLVRQQGINELGQSLLELAPLEEQLRKITDCIVRLFDADFCRVWLTRPGDLCQGECLHAVAEDGPHVCRDRDRCLHLLASSGRYTHIDGQAHRRVPFGCYKIGRIASENHKFLTNDAPNDPRVHNHQWARELGLVSFVGYQIRVPGGDTLGVLALFAKHPIDESEDVMLDGLSSTIALVVDQAAAQEAIEQFNQELEETNQALEESNYLASAANRAKSEFLANMSHEIRTPMTAILGYADLMLEENVGHIKREHVAVIKRNGEHLLELINNILDLSKIEAEKLQIEPTRCSPVQLVAEVVSLMRVQAKAKHLKLETELVGPLPETVLTDPLRLRQVLVNLVGNAIKFTDHGEVRIAVRLTDDSGHPRLCFDVTDTGIGINEEQVGQLFQPFNQVDNSSTRKFGGTGLGLCISKRLAEALGGSIEVRSKPGAGSTFSVIIDPGPLAGIRMAQAGQGSASQRPSITAPAAADQIDLHGRILLAEDEPDNQRLISFLLKKAGAEVTAVENGQCAFEAALAAREAGKAFDVILMDMQMPVMDGYEATRQLRQQGHIGPIIALTAYAMAEDRQKCLDAGCDDFATKPIDRQKILATVAHWMARGRTNDDSPKPITSESNASAPKPTAFVYSQLAADPDLGQLIDLFVQEMPDRINALEAQAKSRDWNELTRTAQQIKGAAGSYGFSEITPYAARLEAAAREALPEENILAALHELLSLCRRVCAGTPQADKRL